MPMAASVPSLGISFLLYLHIPINDINDVVGSVHCVDCPGRISRGDVGTGSSGGIPSSPSPSPSPIIRRC